MTLLLVLAATFLAYANGANDNFKGVATLFGSRTMDYRRALVLGTGATILGSLGAAFLAQGLVASFSGKGLVADSVATTPSFLVSVGLGAGLTVTAATVLGFPVSTTHALTGALVGAGLVASGSVHWPALARKFLLPLAVSPLVSMALAACAQRLMHRAAVGRCRGPGKGEDGGSGDAARPGLLDITHMSSAGLASFARGLNDTPKIAALLVGSRAVNMPGHAALAAVGVGMAVGGLLSARRVAETMSHRITTMDRRDGLAANLVTALLVGVASRCGMPVSTTHVSCGSLFGLGVTTGGARWRTIRDILLAWVITLPVGAACAAGSRLLIGAVVEAGI